MINLLKESLGLYKKNFKTIFGVMLPVVLVGIPFFVYLESSLGLDTGDFRIPSDVSNLAPLLFFAIFFLLIFIWSQMSLSEGVKDKNLGAIRLYSLGWKKLPVFFQEIKTLKKTFRVKHLLLLFIIWFVFNGLTANILQQSARSLLFEQSIFVSLNFLFLLPFFHMYGFSLLKKGATW